MFPSLFSDDRLLVFRHWPGRWLRNGQIVIGDLRKVLVAFENNLPYSQAASRGEKSFLDVITTDSRNSNIPINRNAFVGTPSSTLESTGTGQFKFVKRIIGLPGDTVVIHLSEIHEKLQVLLRERGDSNGNLIWHIPPGYCFVRGDGPESEDSVIWGPIPINFLTGIMLAKLPSISSHRPIE